MESDLIEKYDRLVQRQVELQEEKNKVDHELDRIGPKVKVEKDAALLIQFIDCLRRDGIYIGKDDEFDYLEEPALSKLRNISRAWAIRKYRFSMNVSESGLQLEDMPLPSNGTEERIFPLVIEKLTPHFPISTEVFLRPTGNPLINSKYGVRFKTTLPIEFNLDQGAVMTVWFVEDIQSFRQKLADELFK